MPYTLHRRRRRTIAIQITRSREIRVLAPRRLPLTAVETFLEQKRRWIHRKLDEFADLPEAEAISLEEGAVLPYRGGGVTLRLLDGAGAARLSEAGELEIPAGRRLGAAGMHRKVNDWYRSRCQQIAEETVAALAPRAAALDIPAPREIRCRRMRRRWGSCLPTGTITLNSELLGAPSECFDYVVAHELCHLREANHGPRFYELLGLLVPEWKELRRRLNSESPLGFLEPPKE